MAETPIFPRGRVTLLGVLNLTPDSFSDGGRFVRGAPGGERVDVDGAVGQALRLVRDGAHVVDAGGESTRPGAREVPASVEIARTRPVIEAITKHSPVPISIDTRKAAVAEAALAAGARVVNDVSGGVFDPDLLRVAAREGATLILGHLRGDPTTMQVDPRFEDVLGEVEAELAERVERARAAGVARERIAVDPGIGFGKRLEDNLALLANLGRLRRRLELPVLVGPSRKSFLGRITGDPVEARAAATLAACAVAVFAGADGLRAHDVADARRAIDVARALREARRRERP